MTTTMQAPARARAFSRPLPRTAPACTRARAWAAATRRALRWARPGPDAAPAAAVAAAAAALVELGAAAVGQQGRHAARQAGASAEVTVVLLVVNLVCVVGIIVGLIAASLYYTKQTNPDEYARRMLTIHETSGAVQTSLASGYALTAGALAAATAGLGGGLGGGFGGAGPLNALGALVAAGLVHPVLLTAAQLQTAASALGPAGVDPRLLGAAGVGMPPLPEGADDALVSLLMSWYRSGYCTGHYAARQGQ
mmetsp:Transcript_30253/g.84391  ORF Transcript_30253/g.84391 Transcript_30253/m.84391 type:complete len:252 (+) Transcript_30253:3-758(+)